MTQDTLDPVATAARRPEPRSWPEPPVYVVLPVFVVVAFLMTYRSIRLLDTHIVGNSGDPLLIMWILGWVQHALPHGWGEIWNTSMFFPHTNTLAYSDSMLSAALVEWPLRAVFGQVLGMNLLILAAQTASLWFMYRLALFLSRSWMAAVIAAFSFAFAAPLIAHLAHYQLVLTAFLVPLTLLLLARFLETWAPRFGIGVGLAFAGLATSATYYGLMVACAVPVVVLGYVLWYRPRPVWRFLRGLVFGAAIAVVIALPVVYQYLRLQDDPYFHRSFDTGLATHLGDLLSPPDENYVLTEVWPFTEFTSDRGIENRLFPGVVLTTFGIAGAIVITRALRRRSPAEPATGPANGPTPVDDRWRARVSTLIALGGVVTLVLSFGDEVTISGADVPLPFKALREFVPGFSGIRATSRFTVLTVCALAVCAAFGLAALLRRCRAWVATALFVVLCAVVLAETAVGIPLVRAPDGRVADSVASYLDDHPDGVVAELPMRSPSDTFLWPYLEAPRQYVSLGDTHDRINGYSGYAPPDYDELAATVNQFPTPAALRALDRRDVRYVVLRTRVLGELPGDIGALLREDGVGRYTRATARSIVARIPPVRVRRVAEVPGGIVVELRRSRR